MNDLQKTELEWAIIQLETKIDSYTRTKTNAKRQALNDAECGYRETAQFNKGQEFALEYVIQDLQIILQGLKNVEDNDGE